MKQRFLSFANFLVRLFWMFTRETIETMLMAFGLFYIGASFGRPSVDPHFLNAHESWAVFIQLMGELFAKAGRCGQ
jgi:hypothetical protein